MQQNVSLNNTQDTKNTVSVVKEQQVPPNEEDEYGDEYYEEEEEEEEEEKKAPVGQVATSQKHETMSSDSMDKIRRIVESQSKIPRIIVIKDAQGIEQEYEVLEESEEEEDATSVNMSVLGPNGDEKNIKVFSKG